MIGEALLALAAKSLAGARPRRGTLVVLREE
ncbi:hypothetical protein H4W80_006481 [Nonomuraea angiospora]|uniref:Uncharacterized protein n=1 Tax=Nonomuraea angiospora TaxID=46172 RepID=A0ABR9M6Q2_9ACTN|nr:hypothetical protein [Nonomuraea angiospora]